MIDRAHDLPISRQAKVLNISRGAVYYKPRQVSPKDLRLMRWIDELHLERPFAGARMLRDFLGREGLAVGRRHVATLMKRIGIEALYRRPDTSKPAPSRKIYPYRLRGVTVERPNQVWATDITYIPMARGFVYLVAVIDWFSRRHSLSPLRGDGSRLEPPRSRVPSAYLWGMRPATYATEFIADRHQAQLRVSGLQRPSPIDCPS